MPLRIFCIDHKSPSLASSSQGSKTTFVIRVVRAFMTGSEAKGLKAMLQGVAQRLVPMGFSCCLTIDKKLASGPKGAP